MKKLDALSKKRGFNALFAFAINAVIMLIYLLCFRVDFETIDNIVFSQWITDGFYNITFTSFFLTRALGFLQDLIFPLNAYTLAHVLFAYLGYTAITWVLADKCGCKLAALMTVVVTFVFGVNNYPTISFTRLPGLLCTAGFLLIIHCSAKKGVVGVIFGCLLAIVGGLYRFQVFELMFAMGVAFAGCLTLVRFIDMKKGERSFKALLKLVFEPKRLVAAAAIFALCFALNSASKKINLSTEEMRFYSNYTSLRSSVWDYVIPDYEKFPDEYDALNINANDVQVIREGFCDKDGAMSIDNMRAVAKMRDNKVKAVMSPRVVLRLCLAYAENAVNEHNIELWTALSFFALVAACRVFHRWKKSFLPILFLLAVIVFYAYFLATGRVKYRVMFPIWFSAFVYLIYFADQRSLRPGIVRLVRKHVKPLAAAFAVIALLFCGCAMYLTGTGNIIIDHGQMNDSLAEIYDYMDQHKDMKFELVKLLPEVNDMPNRYDSPFIAVKTDYGANFKYSDCTYYASPFRNKQMKEFGGDNFFANMLSDDVYCVFSLDKMMHYPPMMIGYLEKYYADGKSVDCEVIDDLENFIIVKFFTF